MTPWNILAAPRVGRAVRELSANDVRARARSPVFRGGPCSPATPCCNRRGSRSGCAANCCRRGPGPRAQPRHAIHRGAAGEDRDRRGRDDRRRAGGARTRRVDVEAPGATDAPFVPRGTYIVITEPAPDRLAALGWTGRRRAGRLADGAALLPPDDGRPVAFGAAGSTAGSGRASVRGSATTTRDRQPG